VWALKIQRLEGSRPAIGHGLWGLYVIGEVMKSRETVVTAGARQLQCENASIRLDPRWVAEIEENADIVCWARGDIEPVCAPKHEDDSRLRMWTHAHRTG
jgi:hypothetical protein